MERIPMIVVAALAALVSIMVGTALAKPEPPRSQDSDPLFGQDVVPGEVIVRFEPGSSASQRAAATDAVGAEFERSCCCRGPGW